jgi:hypothetical protein
MVAIAMNEQDRRNFAGRGAGLGGSAKSKIAGCQRQHRGTFQKNPP